jgi:hypothetical protein
MPSWNFCLAAFLIVSLWSSGMAARVLTQELSAVETLPQRRSDLIRHRRALIQGLQNDVRAMSSAVRQPRPCVPTNNQLEACYASCSEFKCVDPSCKTSRSTCSEPGCCRASTSNGSATVIIECYKDCCYAVDENMDSVNPIPCTGAIKDGSGKSKSKNKCFPGDALVELESGCHTAYGQALCRRQGQGRTGHFF